ncbi:MAG: hypothetical protein K0S47_794 [Herbinix sp.]|jgi:lactate dehydrogenase-like 2-hydroxyacid dehydrogenase|nr:hypothetical protein [Herbinix sp.]
MKFKSIIKAFGLMTAGFAAGAMILSKTKNKVIKQRETKVDKFKGYYETLNQWMQLKQEGKSLEQYFDQNGYKSIAIYGMGELGNRLYFDLKDSNIQIKYAIDKNAERTYSELNVVTLEDELEDVDAIVVSAVFAFDEAEKEISKVMSCPIISLKDVVFEI